MSDLGGMGLIGINEGIRAGIQGYYDAEDRRYRKMEMDAKIKAQEDNQRRQKMMDDIELQKNSPEFRRQQMEFELQKTGQKGIWDDQNNLTGAEYRPDYLALKRRAGRGTVNGAPLSIGETQTDKEFAKEYSKYVLGGGFAGVQKNINSAREILNQLGEYEVDPSTGQRTEKFKVKNDRLSGPIAGGMGIKAVRDVINPEGSGVEDRINGLLMQSLKAVAGGNPTDRDLQILLSAGWNRRLSEKENYDRVKALLEDYEQRALAKEEAAKYYERYGTLRGYQGTGLINQQVAGQGQGLIQPGLMQQNRGLIQPEAGAAQKDSKVENYANEHGLTYDQALQLLRSRGYGK